MTTLCDVGCIPVCDFCKHYRFNGDEKGVYIGDGQCVLHNEPSEPYYDCKDFYCFLVDQQTEKEN